MLTHATLRRSSQAPLVVSAWLLPGSDPRAWLEAVATWPIATEALTFYPLATPGEVVPLGVLVVPQQMLALPAGSHALPYGEVTKGFFVPVDGVLSPPLAPAEIPALMRHEVIVFHPVAGLSGFDASDARRAWDFLLPPEQREEAWNFARMVEPLNPALRSVRLAVPITFETLFGDANNDIGSEPLTELPPTADEKSPTLPGKIAQGALGLTALGLMKLAALVPRSPKATQPNWINHIENWAAQKFAGVSQNLERERNRELHRLIEMLEKNPSEGLRHAISLSALAHRGKAPPSSQLARRGLNFNLNNLGGRGAADGWSVPMDVQAQLSKRYREAAQRAASQGDYRRAAAIFAELLGDLSAAAAMLKQGRYFREAALLYRDHLRNETAAAECLAQGGFYGEAIEIYERLNRWLDVADLREREGSHEQAKLAVRRAVEALVATGDIVAAARLLDTRLDAFDEAIELLASPWPQGKQAFAALEERVVMLSRRHKHEVLRNLMEDLGTQSLPSATRVRVVEFLAQQFESLIDDDARKAAAESARVHIAQLLKARTLSSSDEVNVLRSLTRLAPQDRLLKRDATRFREPNIKLVPMPALPSKAPPLLKRITLEKLGTVSLPTVGKWLLMTANANGFYALAKRGQNKLFFTRGSWAGALQSAEWTDPVPDAGPAFLLLPYGDDVICGRVFKALAQKKLPEADAFKARNSLVGTPSWLPEDSFHLAASESTLWAVRIVDQRIVLASFGGGQFIYSRDVTDELNAAGAAGRGTTLSLDATGSPGCVALGYGHHLLVMDDKREIQVCDLGERVLSILTTPEFVGGWVVLLETGAVFVKRGTMAVKTLDDQMSMPRGFVRWDGTLILISGEEGRIITLHNGYAVATFSMPATDMLAVIAAERNEFFVFNTQGVGQRWLVPTLT